jgi:hypothetical protein
VTLQDTSKAPSGSFIGRFKVHNVRLGKPIVLGGELANSELSMVYPQVVLQFKGIYGQWSDELQSPGSFLSPKDRMTIAPGQTKAILVSLPSETQVSAGGREFRILVFSWNFELCISSTPFAAQQARGPVTGFQSVERSNKSLERAPAR